MVSVLLFIILFILLLVPGVFVCLWIYSEKYLYSFGMGQFGQLGHGTFIFESRLPRVVEHFHKGRVKHIACGENHSAVLTGIAKALS